VIPVILGMNDPSGTAVLSSAVPGSAGSRLLALAILGGLTARQYEEGFERRNLLDTKRWSSGRARASAERMVASLEGREVVVLGREVWRAFSPRSVGYFTWVHHHGATWHLIPHPSGRNLAYNNPDIRRRAADVLRRVHDYHHRSPVRAMPSAGAGNLVSSR